MRRWPVRTIPILVALAATDCGAPAAPSANGTLICTARFIHATLVGDPEAATAGHPWREGRTELSTAV
jgi:hypothetical protein